MKNHNTPTSLTQNKNILRIAVGTALILLLPWLAMQFTDAVNWGPADFAAAGALLFGAGLIYELMTRKANSMVYRAAAGAALAGALLLVWMNLAVGMIGSEDNPANLLYIGVLAVGVIGAVVARFRPYGMARALFATALAQALVAAIALITVKDLEVLEVMLLNGFFAALWVGSALLFRRAGASEN